MPTHLSRSSLAATLLITSALALPAGATDARPAAVVADTAAVRIENFGRVNAMLYRGAQPQGRGYADLRALGVKTIINLTSDDADRNEQAMAEGVGMRYVQIPMTTHTPPTPAQLGEFLRVVSDPASQPVYVHCVGGRHRTGVMTAAYRMEHDGWTADRAFKEMKQYNFGADFLHPEFKRFVYTYRADDEPLAETADAVVQRDDAGDPEEPRPASFDEPSR